MSNLELAKKIRRVRKFMLENATRWEQMVDLDPYWADAAKNARNEAAKYLLQLRELKETA